MSRRFLFEVAASGCTASVSVNATVGSIVAAVDADGGCAGPGRSCCPRRGLCGSSCTQDWLGRVHYMFKYLSETITNGTQTKHHIAAHSGPSQRHPLIKSQTTPITGQHAALVSQMHLLLAGGLQVRQNYRHHLK